MKEKIKCVTRVSSVLSYKIIIIQVNFYFIKLGIDNQMVLATIYIIYYSMIVLPI